MSKYDTELTVGQVTVVEFFENEKFAVGKVIHGGMGTIYQLIPIRSGYQALALKTVQDNVDARAFERECEAWLALAHHAHISRALAFGSWRDKPAIMVEWYPMTLAELSVSGCDDTHILNLAEGVVEALEFAYSKTGMIHQDIKPANIMIDKEGQARLSDFGLARCAPQRLSPFWMMHMQEPGSDKPVGGTPFYMAPELFSGGTPSIRTDLFSLGVTLYQFLTGEHPYFEGGKPPQGSPVFRDSPLLKAVAGRSKSMSRLADVIIACLAIDPRKRPQNYAELGLVKPTRLSRSLDESRRLINAAIGRAMLYRDQGRFDLAEDLLTGKLKDHPDDPVILNALGVLMVKQGKTGAAIEHLSHAFQVLEKSNGYHAQRIYADPAVNLAGQLIRERQFSKSHAVLKMVWGWVPEDIKLMNNTVYPEFGWMYLYEGEFKRAADYLLNTLSKKGLDNDALKAAVEASWLSGQLKQHADEIMRMLLPEVDTKVSLALCGSLVSPYASPLARRQFIEALSEVTLREIATIETTAGLAPGTLRFPNKPDAQEVILITLDDYLTGGRHCGTIRQTVQSRLA